MNITKLNGIIPPIITPMNADESVNYEELKNQTKRMMDAGVHGIFAFGTNGECYALSNEEKKNILKTVVETVNNKVPVLAGTGCITTKDTIEMSKMAEDLGADVLSVITPSFAAASQDELYAHYMNLSENTQLPIILYNIPARTGNSLAPGTVERLAKNAKNIIGIKDSSGNFDNFRQYVERTQGMEKEFSVFIGNDSLILPALVFGGVGGVAGCANVFPHTMVGIYEEWKKGNFKEAQRLQDSIRPFRNCFKYGNPNTIVKIAAGLLGNNVGPCRRPFCNITEEAMQVLKHTLDECVSAGMK